MSDRFQSGQPLDVSTLNNIDDRLVELESKFTSFSTANTVEASFGPTIPVITGRNTKQFNIGSKANKEFYISSELNNAFSGIAGDIYVVAVPASDVTDNTNLSICISGEGTNRLITLSNNGKDTIKAGVQWIAFARKLI